MTRRLLVPLLATCLLVANSCNGAAGRVSTPERIEPMRKRFLTPGEYQRLREEWKAYTEAHPGDALGWVQLSKAANYVGEPCRDVIRYAERAYRLAPNDADVVATYGGWKWSAHCEGQPTDAAESIRLLERAIELDPENDSPRIRLWVMRLSKDDRQGADRELVWLLDHGRIPEPLVDYGHNLLVDLEPNAILLTNGDNDTYPAIALQAGRGFRSDVTVVNLSLLNLSWFRRQLREGRHPVPVPLLDQGSEKDEASQAAVQGLIDSLARDGWARPLYVACTVNLDEHRIPNRLSLEGLVYRMLSEPGAGSDVDIQRTRRNLRETYRLESTTSTALNWNDWSSLRQLMLNDAAADMRLAAEMAKAGEITTARASMERSLEMAVFHRSTYVTDLVTYCRPVGSRYSPELAKWKKKLGM